MTLAATPLVIRRLHNATSRETTGKSCAGNPHARFERGSCPWLREIHRALKPNGILGVEEHRASPGANAEEAVKKGYLPEASVIETIEAAGFARAGRSEINANPRDTRDHPNGVWSLSPSFQAGPDYSPAGAPDRARYAAIGESDRMTLKFLKVGP